MASAENVALFVFWLFFFSLIKPSSLCVFVLLKIRPHLYTRCQGEHMKKKARVGIGVLHNERAAVVHRTQVSIYRLLHHHTVCMCVTWHVWALLTAATQTKASCITEGKGLSRASEIHVAYIMAADHHPQSRS